VSWGMLYISVLLISSLACLAHHFARRQKMRRKM